MIMEGLANRPSAAQTKTTLPVQHLDLSFEPYNFSGQATALGETAQGVGGRAGAAAGAGGPGEAAFDDTLNTPRTATSDFNFNFIKSQLDFSQEAPPIIGERSVFLGIFVCIL